MKTVLVLCALAVLAISQASGANLILGSVQPGDRLLNNGQLYQPAIANRTQTQQFIFRGNSTTRITSIQAREIGATQFARMELLSGGLGSNNATLRATSRQSYGFNYQIRIYGR